jgi:MscS family membrane protein
VYSWPEWLEEFLSKGLKLVVAASITYVALKFVDLALGLWREKATGPDDKVFDDQLFPIVRKSLKLFVVVVAVLVTAQNLHFNITGLLASLSVGGLALGLAAQDTVANLFGAVSVFVDKPFRVGDRIRIGADVDGTVETIGLRSTRVRNLDGHLVTIPNKTMGNATITNVAARPNIKTTMEFGLTYDTPAERVLAATKLLEEIYRAHPMTQDLLVSFHRFADSSLNILVVHWWNSTDYKEYLGGMQALNLEIKRRFDAAGFSFAFPSRTVYHKYEPGMKPGESEES